MPKNLRHSLTAVFDAGSIIVGFVVVSNSIVIVKAVVNGIGGVSDVGAIAFGVIVSWALVVAHIRDRRSGETSMVRKEAACGARRFRALKGLSRLLPAEVRDEYCEEWAAWMADLREDGTPRVRRWMELLSLVLIAMQYSAIGQRVEAVRRAVGR